MQGILEMSLGVLPVLGSRLQRHASLIDVCAVTEMSAAPTLDAKSLRLSFGATVTLETLIHSLDGVAQA